MLILVVGPSGAGKDTLLDGARDALPNARFVRRVITRPADAGGEDHESVTEQEFRRRPWALQWHAHGLHYGIPADIAEDLDQGRTVIANISRSVIQEAASKFTIHVIEITASPEILSARLAARGRESPADIATRLTRNIPLPSGIPLTRVINDASMREGVACFVAAVNQATEAARRS